METSDPDDVMTLAILASRRDIHLVGVTVTPGGAEQYSLVKHVLRRLARDDVPVGVFDPGRMKPCVSEFHYVWLGEVPFLPEVPPHARDVLAEVIQRNPDATYLTGGPLKNYGVFTGPDFLPYWVGQGGFAGDAIVLPQHRLPKFVGRETCPTFNLNGDVAAAKAILCDARIRERVLVSKNVCHGLPWDREFHERVCSLSKRSAGLDLVLNGMAKYLKKHPGGKLLHDPLAATVAIERSVCSLDAVEVYRERGEWGSRWPENGDSNAKITTSIDRGLFFDVLTAY